MIEKLVRSEIKSFVPYNANQVPYRVKLDANESPFDLPESVKHKLAKFFMEAPGSNLYPDTDSIELRGALAAHWNIGQECIIVGNGSDQLIQLLINTFVGKDDKVLCPTPSFGMYKLTTAIAGGVPISYTLDRQNGYKYDAEKIVDIVNREKIKLVFLCTPNNPTGGVIPEKDIVKVVEECSKSIVVVDEAYAEFSGETVIPFAEKYENLVVLRTFSKAYGLAGIRCGYSISSKEMAVQLNKVRPPYNISSLSQLIARLVLDEKREIMENIGAIKKEREFMYGELSKLEGVQVYPSHANFLLVKVPNSEEIYRKLMQSGILVRDFGNAPMLENCLRLTIGTRLQNELLLKELKNIL